MFVFQGSVRAVPTAGAARTASNARRNRPQARPANAALEVSEWSLGSFDT